MTKTKRSSRSVSRTSSRRWRQLSLFEPLNEQETTPGQTSRGSESLTTQSEKSRTDGQSSSQRKGARPLAEGKRQYVGVSVKGIPIGEYAARAKYTDHEVDLVFRFREEGYSYRKIAEILEIPRSTCFAICHGLIRAQVVYRWKRRN